MTNVMIQPIEPSQLSHKSTNQDGTAVPAIQTLRRADYKTNALPRKS
jgi:hypothetical protein